MSTHNIPFFYIKKKKITLNYPKSAARDFFQGTQEQVRSRGGKRAIIVRAIEVLLYIFFDISFNRRQLLWLSAFVMSCVLSCTMKPF